MSSDRPTPPKRSTLALPPRSSADKRSAGDSAKRSARQARLGGEPVYAEKAAAAGRGERSERGERDRGERNERNGNSGNHGGRPATGGKPGTGPAGPRSGSRPEKDKQQDKQHSRPPRPAHRSAPSERPPRTQERPAPANPRPAYNPPVLTLVAPTQLPPDSLALSLWLAAQAVAAVLQGASLSEAQRLWRQSPATPSVRAGAQDLAYGALRRSEAGQFQLAQLLTKPLDEPTTHALLLCATYRLETRPDAAHTVVDQAVQAATYIAGGNFKSLINAVLRNALRRADELAAALAADPVALHRHPAWWLERLQNAYPQDWRQVVAAGNAQPPLTLRVNTRRTERAALLARFAEAGIEARPVGEAGIRLLTPRPVLELPGFAEGDVSVQDLGAQDAALRLGARDGEHILDACAAPGGKTAHVLERAAVSLVALDVDPLRCQRIQENLDRLHLTDPARVTVAAADCRAVEDWWDGKAFDRILADVPCSASGVVRRHPDAKWLRRPDDIHQFARTQRQIIDALWPLLKPGGTFLYATCSVFPAENGEQVDALLHRHADAREISRAQLLPGDEHDGFFYALLVKQG